MQSDTMPERWEDVEWPVWVPMNVRQEIQRFWSGPGRGPREWMESAVRNHAPAFGSMATVLRGKPGLKVLCTRADYEVYPVRYVHAWNNIGRGVHPDGSYDVVSLGDPEEVITEYQQ